MPARHLSRRTVLIAGAGLILPNMTHANPTKILNPLVQHRADPHIFRHDDGQYYMMATVPEYDRLVIRRAATIAALASAEEVTVWRRPASGKMAGHIWAPELHRFDGQWHIYFGAGDGGDVFHVRTFVLSTADADPLTGQWALTGQVDMPWDTFNLDATTFVHRGQRYLLWAQHEPGIATNSNLYLAPLASPVRLAATPTRLTVPEFDWEIIGFKVNEGPAVLARNGRLFLTYSASATDEHYGLGLLTARDDADIMNPASWSKSPRPVFKSSPANNVWGPGHNGFTVDEDGRDMLVYHARDYRFIQGDPLNDPNRHTRVQPFGYDADGVPDFGEPVAIGSTPMA